MHNRSSTVASQFANTTCSEKASARDLPRIRSYRNAHPWSRLSQQKLRAWQPVFTANWAIFMFVVIGSFCVSLGIILVVTSDLVIECFKEYGGPSCLSDMSVPCKSMKINLTITTDDCSSGRSTLPPPSFLYYQINNFFQNHRRYLKSRDDEQLSGAVITERKYLSSCEPVVMDSDQMKIRSPCGLVASSVFNDTFSLIDSQNHTLRMNESASVIAWETDIRRKFKNPPPNAPGLDKIDQWLDEEIFPGKVENGHFIVWMRGATTSDFSYTAGSMRRLNYL